MAPSIIYNNAVQGETFLPGQIFAFGGFALQANSLGHLEQIESYAPGRQVRFDIADYTHMSIGEVFSGYLSQVHNSRDLEVGTVKQMHQKFEV